MKIRNYEQADKLLQGRNAQSRKLANNTYLKRHEHEDSISLRLHNSDIVIYHRDGNVEFDVGSYRTVTSKDRLNEFSPISVRQAKGVWYASYGGIEVCYCNSLVLRPDGTFVGEGTGAKQVAALTKRVRKFADEYIKALDAGIVEKPGPGDCWMCLMFAKANMGGSEHILGHLDEQYYVPSLLARAIERYPVSLAAKAYLSDKWAGTSNGRGWADIGQAQLKKSLYRYLKQELGIAA